MHGGCIRCFSRRFARSESIRKLVFEVKPYLPIAASRVMLMFGDCLESCCLRCMESSPIGDGELVPQEGWILRADRDSCHTIRQLINHFDRNLWIELEPRLKDSFLLLLRPNVHYKELAPVLKRCPTHRIQRGFRYNADLARRAANLCRRCQPPDHVSCIFKPGGRHIFCAFMCRPPGLNTLS